MSQKTQNRYLLQVKCLTLLLYITSQPSIIGMHHCYGYVYLSLIPRPSHVFQRCIEKHGMAWVYEATSISHIKFQLQDHLGYPDTLYTCLIEKQYCVIINNIMHVEKEMADTNSKVTVLVVDENYLPLLAQGFPLSALAAMQEAKVHLGQACLDIQQSSSELSVKFSWPNPRTRL